MSNSRDLHQLASAFVAAAIEAEAVGNVTNSLRIVGEMFAQSPSVLVALSEPALSVDKRITAAREALSDIHPFVVNALSILIERDMAQDFSAASEAIFARFAELGVYHEVAVSSATQLHATDKKALTEFLQKKLGGDIDMHETINPALLAGVIVEYNGTRLDASVHGRLNRLTQHLYGT